ncbi:glycosyltransferase family 1 protein [Clostridium perfringens]|nr:glycosyltransferase family 1 protein [Clostridium perfringens]MDM0958567.1 glycosyltransferase family 1 protein [Clostridium perfringens]
MKKLVFNATILNNNPTGLGVYCKNVLSRMDKNLYDYVVYTDEFNGKKVDNKKSITLNIKSKNKLKSIFLRSYKFKKFIASQKEIVNYSPTQHGVTKKNIKQIVTVHDLMPLYFPKGRVQQYIYYKYLLKKIMKNSEIVITCSNNTKNDIIREYNISPNRIKVIYDGFDRPKIPIDKKSSKEYIKNKYGIENYIFMMGIHYNYKNLHSVIEAYSEIRDKLTIPLVIAGGDKGKYAIELKKLVEEKGLEDKIKFLGYIPDEDKDLLYQAAYMFIYPSKYEGFGLPVLEAMANNTIVACSNTSSLPEVVGDAALKFNPDNIIEIKEIMLKIISLSSDEYQAWIKKGLNQIEKFSWEKCTREIEDVIKSVVIGD